MGGTFGATLRATRRARGLTQQAVADLAGCTKGYLSLIENGRKGPPSGEVLERLETALGLPAGRLATAAALAEAPASVRHDLARAEADRARVRRLAALLASGSLDEMYQSGALQRLVGQFESGDGAGRGAVEVALPREVPLINRVAAGYPRGFTDLGYPARVADDYVRCPDIADPDAFAARVVGDSMEPAYREGDVVVFSPARAVESGDDCFARLERDDESTFKRVYFERGPGGEELIRLQPVNSRYSARVLPREEVSGLYRAVTVMRSV